MSSCQNLWKPEYLLEIDVIDEQHKGFLEICVEAAHLCERAHKTPLKATGIIRTLYRMRCYAFKHFHTEESLLLKHNYPKLFEHFSYHDEFLRALQGYTSEIHDFLSKGDKGEEGLLTVANRINDYVGNWWGEHILNHDKQYVEFIKDRRGH